MNEIGEFGADAVIRNDTDRHLQTVLSLVE